jgi:Tol biopolymer transport system component
MNLNLSRKSRNSSPVRVYKLKMKGLPMKKTISLLIFTLFALSIFGLQLIQAQDVKSSPSGEQIAFIRNGDIWLMNADGSDQKPLVSGMGNAKGRLSWSPDGKIVAFSRQGRVQINYPEGGGGQHSLYDLFYGYTDSLPDRNNFWMGFTSNLGAQAPDWSKSGKKICFTYDIMANVVDATGPDYVIGIYNTENKEISKITLPKEEKNYMALMPTISPDGSKVCFVLAEFVSSQMKQMGLVVVPVDGAMPSTEDLLGMAEMIPDGTSPAWSPDGKKIAYMKSDGVYYANADFTGEKLVTHPEEGLWVSGIPCWSPNSDKLAFGTSNGAIYTVNVDGTGMKMISGPGNDSNPAWTK